MGKEIEKKWERQRREREFFKEKKRIIKWWKKKEKKMILKMKQKKKNKKKRKIKKEKKGGRKRKKEREMFFFKKKLVLFHPQPSHTIAYNHCLPPAGKYHFNSNSGIIVFNNPSYFFLLIYNKKIRLSLNIGLGEVYFYWSNLEKKVSMIRQW